MRPYRCTTRMSPKVNPKPRPEVDQVRLGQIYDHTAPFYDGVVLEHQSRAKETAIELLARRPDEPFLEVGVGTGWAFERILKASGGRADPRQVNELLLAKLK